MLAHDAARQLTAEGHVCRVVMIDSLVAEGRLPRGEVARLVEFLGDLAGGRPPTSLAAAVHEAAGGDVLGAARAAAVAHGLLPPEVDRAGFARLSGAHTHNLAVLAAHRPAP